MKKMKKTELILGILSLISVGLNLFLVFGGQVLSMLTLSILSVIYFVFGFALFNDIRFRDIFNAKSFQGISTTRIIGSIAAGISLSITLVGILFKIQSLPGATFELMSGLFFLIIVSIIGAAQFLRTKSKFYIGIFKRALLIGGFGLTLILLPKGAFIDFKYRNHPSYAQALKNVVSNPLNPEFQAKLQEERQKMNNDK
jgi:hypothetical protein